MTWLNAVLVLAVVVLGVAIWSIKRHKDPHLELKSEAPLEELIPSIAGTSLGMAIRGNAVEIFQTARSSTRGSRTSMRRGARSTSRLSCGKRGGWASAWPTRSRARRAAGWQLAIYHPRTLKNIGVISERDHRKLAILDGRIAWVGGHCIVDEWLGDAEDRHHVRDLSVRLRGRWYTLCSRPSARTGSR